MSSNQHQQQQPQQSPQQEQETQSPQPSAATASATRRESSQASPPAAGSSSSSSSSTSPPPRKRVRSSSRPQPLHQQPQLVSLKVKSGYSCGIFCVTSLPQLGRLTFHLISYYSTILVIYANFPLKALLGPCKYRLPTQLQQHQQQQQRLGMIGDSPESAAAAAVAAANTGDVEVAVDAVLTAAGSPVQQASVKAARMKSKTARRLSNAQQVRIRCVRIKIQISSWTEVSI